MHVVNCVNWTKWTLVIFVFVIIDITLGVRINKLQVPEVTHIGNPVVLDCDYSWEETKDEGLVVKWYFNEEKIPVYQWIATKKPQVLGDGIEYKIKIRDLWNHMWRLVSLLYALTLLTGDVTIVKEVNQGIHFVFGSVCTRIFQNDFSNDLCIK
ncbi:hypothetical protein FQR65_LT06057 [Abscondita terminalis]|nr:hypothetical protein FQR65_LT06057 [Abscondita terminalis]